MTPAQIAASVRMPEPSYPGARIAGQPNRVYLDSELLAHATAVAAAAVAAEREACAVVCGRMALHGGLNCAAAIRARSAEKHAHSRSRR